VLCVVCSPARQGQPPSRGLHAASSQGRQGQQQQGQTHLQPQHPRRGPRGSVQHSPTCPDHSLLPLQSRSSRADDSNRGHIGRRPGHMQLDRQHCAAPRLPRHRSKTTEHAGAQMPGQQRRFEREAGPSHAAPSGRDPVQKNLSSSAMLQGPRSKQRGGRLDGRSSDRQSRPSHERQSEYFVQDISYAQQSGYPT